MRGEEFPAPCLGKCRDIPPPITPHREVRLLGVVEPGEGPAFGRVIEAECGICRRVHPLLRPPDAEGWRQLREYRRQHGLAGGEATPP